MMCRKHYIVYTTGSCDEMMMHHLSQSKNGAGNEGLTVVVE